MCRNMCNTIVSFNENEIVVMVVVVVVVSLLSLFGAEESSMCCVDYITRVRNKCFKKKTTKNHPFILGIFDLFTKKKKQITIDWSRRRLPLLRVVCLFVCLLWWQCHLLHRIGDPFFKRHPFTTVTFGVVLVVITYQRSSLFGCITMF